MVMLPHALTGAFLGSKLKSPGAAFVLGGLSHFLLDAVPHADYPIRGRSGKLTLLADTCLALGATALVARTVPEKAGRRSAWAGALGGVAPDIVSFSQRFFLGGSTAWHDWAHTRPASLPGSLILQAGLSGALLALSLRQTSVPGGAGDS